jgi:translation elongation factor EF-G
LDYTNITVIEINIEKKELRNRYLYKIFANLNSGGTSLTPQELRNGIYRCEFYKMLSEVNENNERWNELFGNETDSSRNIERLLTFCAYKYYVKFENNKFTIDNYKNMNKLLNDFSEEAVNFNENKINEYKKDIENFISLLKGKISKQLLKQSLLEILFTVINKTNCQMSITEEFYINVLKNGNYKGTIKTGNRTQSAIESKLEAVYNEIYKFIK